MRNRPKKPKWVRETAVTPAPALVPGTAKLFMNGRSQAVRLPKAYRFEGDEVAIRREGDAVILEPITKRGWPKGYWERLDRLAKGLDFPLIERLPPRPVPTFDDL